MRDPYLYDDADVLKNLLKDCAGYVRDALVKASDGQYSEYHYLEKIFKDAILQG